MQHYVGLMQIVLSFSTSHCRVCACTCCWAIGRKMVGYTRKCGTRCEFLHFFTHHHLCYIIYCIWNFCTWVPIYHIKTFAECIIAFYIIIVVPSPKNTAYTYIFWNLNFEEDNKNFNQYFPLQNYGVTSYSLDTNVMYHRVCMSYTLACIYHTSLVVYRYYFCHILHYRAVNYIPTMWYCFIFQLWVLASYS